MKFIDLRNLNVEESIKTDSDLDKLTPKIHNFSDVPNINNIPQIKLINPKEINQNLLQASEIMPEISLNVFEQAQKSLKELQDFEFKNLDIDNFYDKELKRVNQLLL